MNGAKRFIVSGLVQGVGFRYFVLKRASERELVGFARNLADGRVEVWAEGSVEALEAMKGDLEIGSRFSRVSKVEESTETSTNLYTSFTIEGT